MSGEIYWMRVAYWPYCTDRESGTSCQGHQWTGLLRNCDSWRYARWGIYWGARQESSRFWKWQDSYHCQQRWLHMGLCNPQGEETYSCSAVTWLNRSRRQISNGTQSLPFMPLLRSGWSELLHHTFEWPMENPEISLTSAAPAVFMETRKWRKTVACSVSYWYLITPLEAKPIML